MNPDARAAELCRYFTLSDEGRKFLDPEILPENFVAKLATEKRLPDAVQVIAHQLPKRQSVFWALQCVRQTDAAATGPEAENALKAAERWIAEPTEDNRKAALKAADAADAGTPAGCTALAAFYSDGLPRTDDPRQNARAYFMTAKLVASAVLLAATVDPERMQSRFEDFVAKGVDIVRRSKR